MSRQHVQLASSEGSGLHDNLVGVGSQTYAFPELRTEVAVGSDIAIPK
jgi:hypothetical protein